MPRSPVTGAGLERPGRVQDAAQAGGAEGGGRARAAWRAASRGWASTEAGGAGTWTQANPAASISFSEGADGHHS